MTATTTEPQVLVMQSPLTEHWYAVTKWHEEGVGDPNDGREAIVADVKFDVTAQVRAIIKSHVDDALAAEAEAEQDRLDVASHCPTCSTPINMDAPDYCSTPYSHEAFYISVRHGDHLWTAASTGRPLNVGGARYERVPETPEDPLDEVVMRNEEIKAAEGRFRAACIRARQASPPVAYAEIGKRLGVTRQAAWERISKWMKGSETDGE